MVKDRMLRLTPAGKAKLEDELSLLRTKKLPELSARIQESTEHGDVSDNSEYEAVKEEYVLTEARIRELEQILDRAEIVDHVESEGEVGFGSTVMIRGDDGLEETWTLVGPEEADTREGTISTESPVGQALIGRRVGESTSVKTPGGTIVYTVVQVD
ncbi:MAG: transcription elongation factor GreA [Thermomicrobiales bacterium]|jgi:transcription elongation factor GreA